MEMRFDGIKLFCNDGKVINERVSVKISFLTALLFVDGNNVSSYYPQYLFCDELAEMIQDECKEHGAELTMEESLTIAKYIKGAM